MQIVNILLVVLLIMMTAFFVAAEFAIVKIRGTRIEYLIESGNKKAVHVKKLLNNLDGYLSACQLGITVTALGLGWLGESTVLLLLSPVFNALQLGPEMTSVLSFVIAFFTITYLHVVVGELAPKTIAIQKAEAISMLLARPLIWFYKIMYPFIWLLNGSARLFIRLFGFRATDHHEEAHTEEELRYILSQSYKSGKINQAEMTYVNNIFEFDERLAKEVMVPRTEMVCLYKGKRFEDTIADMYDGRFTRYPVAAEDKDHIVGLVNLKEIFAGQFADENSISMESYIRPILHVSEATPIKQVLLKMQKERIHMAIVNDEYGGTAGLITVEDVLEEIVGDIRDEFDVYEPPDIEELDRQTMVVSGKLKLEEVNELLGTQMDEEDIDTIGGWIFKENLDVKVGSVVEYGVYQFIVEEIEGYHIKKIKITKHAED